MNPEPTAAVTSHEGGFADAAAVGSDPETGAVPAPNKGGVAPAPVSGLDPELQAAYDLALSQGLREVDLTDTFAPARAGRILEAVTEWRSRCSGGPCAGCSVVAPRRGRGGGGWREGAPRFVQMEGRPACQWCASFGSWDAVRGAVLQAVCGMRSDEWIAPAEVLPLAYDLDPAPASRSPWLHLTGEIVLAVRDWASRSFEQFEFKRSLTDADRSRVPGVLTLNRVIRSRVERPAPLVGAGSVVRPPDAGFVPTVASVNRNVDPRSAAVLPTPAVQHFTNLVLRRRTARGTERDRLDAQIRELIPVVEPQVNEMVALKRAKARR